MPIRCLRLPPAGETGQRTAIDPLTEPGKRRHLAQIATDRIFGKLLEFQREFSRKHTPVRLKLARYDVLPLLQQHLGRIHACLAAQLAPDLLERA